MARSVAFFAAARACQLIGQILRLSGGFTMAR